MDETKGLLKRVRAEATGMFSEVPAPGFKGSMKDTGEEEKDGGGGGCESISRGGVRGGESIRKYGRQKLPF